VVRTAPGLAARWLEEGVGGAVRALYLWRAEGAEVLAAADGLDIVDERPGLEHHLDESNRLCATETAAPAPFRVQIEAWGRVEGWNELVPVTVLAKSLSAGYTLVVSVLRLAPVEPDDRRFAVPSTVDGGS
jgi:hypothetical protein